MILFFITALIVFGVGVLLYLSNILLEINTNIKTAINKNCLGDIMESGELIVIGADEVKIDLPLYPSKIDVSFHGDCEVTPCNPHHQDKLTWELHRSFRSHHGCILVIKWDVSAVREIKWTAYF